MEHRDYIIMSGNIPVAEWKNGNLTVLNENLLPLFLKRVPDADQWLETRAIDSHRANSRLLKKALRLKLYDDAAAVMHVNAATITDNYWIREENSVLTYEDAKFSDDCFASLALRGDYDSFNRAANSKRSQTPELTNIGSFEKCWRLKDGNWWMYKKASHHELFSELFAYQLGCALGMNMAEYQKGDGYIKTLDFTGQASMNFEPASAFMGDDEDYEDVIAGLQKLCPDAVPDYIRMIFLDTIIANPDRHTNNFGLLRDIKTGRLLGLAPNFDNNMALIARGYPSQTGKKDILISLFREVLCRHSEYQAYLPEVTEEIVRDFETECEESR